MVVFAATRGRRTVAKRDLTRRSFLAGCALAAPAIRFAEASCSEKPLRIRAKRNFQSFDPADAWGDDATISRNILAPLVRYKRQTTQGGNWEWEKHIVTSIQANDRRTFSFRLRDETWAGKDDITPDDVEYSFQRIAGLTGKAIPASNRILWRKLDRIEVKDQRSAIIRLKDDDPDLILGTLPTVGGCVINKKHVEGLSSNKFTFDPGRTSGRYKICDISANNRVLLAREDAWKGDAVQIAAAEFVVIVKDDAAQAAWRAGEIDVYQASRDVLHNLPPGVQSNRGRDLRISTSRVVYLAMAVTRGALGDLRLRRSVQFGVDPNAIGRAAYGTPEALLATGLVPRGWPGWNSEPLYRYRPDEARRLVSEAGHRGPLRLVSQQDPILDRVVSAVQEQLKQLGIDIEVTNASPLVWQELTKGEADIAVLIGPSVNPLAVFERFRSSSPFAFAQPSQYNRWFLESLESGDRAAALRNLNRLLVEDGAVAPLLEDHTVWWVPNNIVPAFGPDGDAGDLGDWTRG